MELSYASISLDVSSTLISPVSGENGTVLFRCFERCHAVVAAVTPSSARCFEKRLLRKYCSSLLQVPCRGIPAVI